MLPALVAVLALMVGAMGWAHAQWQAYHAAGTAARVAITQDTTAATAAALRVAPGADVTVRRDGRWVTVTVVIPGHRWWPSVEATVEAFDE